jgi:hypothetical protein
MEKEVIDKLTDVFGPVKWFEQKILGGFKNEGWFVLETVPLPPEDELEAVISDIINGCMVDFADGKVRHYSGCGNPEHKINDHRIKSVLPHLKKQSFKVAVCTGTDKMLEGQPIVISLEPRITYTIFPDHPHLNMGCYIHEINKYLPDSFCYGFTVEPERYGPSVYDRYINTFDEITLWLLRHQVWEAVRDKFGKGVWIGPHEGKLPSWSFINKLNPQGKCRCGSKKIYRDCHLPIDLKPEITQYAKRYKIPEDAVLANKINGLTAIWNKNVFIPESHMISHINVTLK